MVWTLINNGHLLYINTIPEDLLGCFDVLKKFKDKFDCLVHDMLLIRELKPTLNVQSDENGVMKTPKRRFISLILSLFIYIT